MFSIIIHLKQNIIIITIQFSSTVSSIPLVELTIHSIIIIKKKFFFLLFEKERKEMVSPILASYYFFWGGYPEGGDY